MSAYSNRVLYHGELSKTFLEKKFPDKVKEIPSFTPDLNKFIENLDVYLTIRPIKHHFQPISTYLTRKQLTSIKHVYSLENISGLERDLSQFVNES